MLDNLKEQALFRLLNDYIDVLGGTTLTHKSQSNPLDMKWNNENVHLFNGEMALLIILNNLQDSIYTEKIIANYKRHLMSCRVVVNGKIVPGLFARHPDPYKFTSEFHGLSRDEHAGIAFLCVATRDNRVMKDIIDYGKLHNYAYIEENPGFDPIKEAGGAFFATIKKLIKRKDDPLIKQLSRIRQYNDRSFYKLIAEESPSFFELFQMYIGILMSEYSEREDTSGKIMSFFKLKSLELIGHKSKLFTLVKYLFKKRMISLYGANYMREVVFIYFKDTNHPIHTLIDGIVL